MPFPISARLVIRAVTGTLLIALTSAAFAADAPAAPPTPTKEMRERMASLHEQMAACLRSDKPMSECRTEMQKNCQSTMGSRGCTRMMGATGMKCGTGGMMGMGQGMHGRMRSSPPK